MRQTLAFPESETIRNNLLISLLTKRDDYKPRKLRRMPRQNVIRKLDFDSCEEIQGEPYISPNHVKSG